MRVVFVKFNKNGFKLVAVRSGLYLAAPISTRLIKHLFKEFMKGKPFNQWQENSIIVAKKSIGVQNGITNRTNTKYQTTDKRIWDAAVSC